MVIGKVYPIVVKVDLKNLSSDEVGLELVITENEESKAPRITDIIEFENTGCDGSICTFKYNLHPNHPGSFNYGFRLFPKNQHLPHRQDFGYIKWI